MLAELQRANLTTSLREIYYRTKHTIKNSHENTFDGQNESDPLIEDLEVTLEALREELHVRAENSGTVVGPLVLVDDGDRGLHPGLAKAVIRFPPSSSRNTFRSANAQRILSFSSRKAPSGTAFEDKLAQVQLHPAYGQRPAAPRCPAPGAQAARRIQPSRLRPRR